VVVGATTAALAGLAGGLTRRGQLARVEHAAQLALADQRGEIEHERATVLAERNRIAREVHDVLAHTLSALSVQLEALGSLLDDEPVDRGRLRGSVQRARGLVVDGLDETRRAVAVLRDEPVALAEQLRDLAAGDGATFAVLGDPRPLPPAAGLALLRVTQEAVTNARKHAPGAPVTITLTFHGDTAAVVVENPTAAAASAATAVGGGYGLRGMRERSTLVGGTVTAGRTADGWRVDAEVPI
jgi:signal transduction histidine kinase